MLSEGVAKTLAGTGSERNAIIIRKGSQAEMQSGIEESAVGLLRASPEAAPAAQGTLSTAELVVLITAPRSNGSGVANVVVRGVSAGSFPLREGVKVIEGRTFTPGTDEVIIGRAMSKRIAGAELGKELQLKRNRPVRVVGVFEASGSSFESEVWGDLDSMRTIFNRQGTVSSVTLRLKDASGFEALRTRIASDPRLGLEAKRESTYYEEQSQGLSLFLTALGMIIAVFFSFGAMIGAMITMYAQVAQRGREIGTLRALGFRRRKILLSFLLEAVLLSVLGGSLGILGALGMSFVEVSTVNFATFSEVVFRFTPSVSILVTAFVFASLMGLLGGFFPAIRAARVSPVQAMRQ
jgi:putative ABC transport system permease protein